MLTNPNVLVIGAVGSAKSSLIKTYLFRQAVFGRIPWVIDPKGEYGPLARALGVEPIRLAPGGGDHAEPDRAARRLGEPARPAARASRAGALGRDARARRGGRRCARRCASSTRATARADAARRRRAAAAPDRRDGRAAGHDAPSASRAALAQAALGLQRLCEGELRGMFDAPTTPGCELDGRAVVLDLSAVYHSAALGILMTCAAAWQRAAIAAQHARADRDGRPAPKVINVADEAWKILGVLGIGEWLQDSFKRSRAYGIQNVIVMHRLSDLSAAGAAGSREVALAEGLLHDAQTRVVYAQYEDEVPRMREAARPDLGRGRRSCPQLDPGIALWKVGRRSFLVQHRYSADEAELVDTDARMLDASAACMSARPRATLAPARARRCVRCSGCVLLAALALELVGRRGGSAVRRRLGVAAAGRHARRARAAARSTSTIRGARGRRRQRRLPGPAGLLRRARPDRSPLVGAAARSSRRACCIAPARAGRGRALGARARPAPLRVRAAGARARRRSDATAARSSPRSRASR